MCGIAGAVSHRNVVLVHFEALSRPWIPRLREGRAPGPRGTIVRGALSQAVRHAVRPLHATCAIDVIDDEEPDRLIFMGDGDCVNYC
jgi:hypothetical protein